MTGRANEYKYACDALDFANESLAELPDDAPLAEVLILLREKCIALTNLRKIRDGMRHEQNRTADAVPLVHQAKEPKKMKYPSYLITKNGKPFEEVSAGFTRFVFIFKDKNDARRQIVSFKKYKGCTVSPKGEWEEKKCRKK